MQGAPLVSIIINNYNYGCFLKDAIDSALRQSYRHIEVIIVDDGSTDNSRLVIEAYQNRIIPVFKENGDQASAFNAGFAVSHGDIICFLDSDDIFVETKAEKIVQALMHQSPNLGWCFHTVALVDKATENFLGATLAFPNQATDSSCECDFRATIRSGKLPFYAPPTSGLCFTRSLLQQLFPIPEALGLAADRYLSYTAMALSQGYFLNEQLTQQGIHGKNDATFMMGGDVGRKRALHTVASAYFVRQNFPELQKFSNRVFARGLSLTWKHGGILGDGQSLIDRYFSIASPLERLRIYLIAIYQNRPWKKVQWYKLLDEQQVMSEAKAHKSL